MKNAMEFLDRVAARARHEATPPLDVSHRVLAELRHYGQEDATPFLVFSAGSLAAALAALVYGFFLVSTITDPLTALLGASSSL